MARYIIVGAGVAGRRAAEIIRKRSPEAEILVVEGERSAFYYRPMLGEILGGRLDGEQVAGKERERLARLGVRLLAEVRVVSVDVKAQEVVLDRGERLGFDRLLVATGSVTKRLGPEAGSGGGVAYLDTLAQALEIASLGRSVRKAAVYGLSVQGLAALRGFSARGISCTLMVPEGRLWPGVLDPVASGILEEHLEKAGVSLVKEVSVQELVRENGDLKAVVTSNGDRVAADLLLVAGPQVPRVDALKDTGLATAEGILVDENLRTRHEAIFAAGDAAVVPWIHAGEKVRQPGWLSAWRQGNVAGLNMVGRAVPYKGFPALRTKALDVDVVCLGLTDAQGGDVQEESGDYPYEELPYIYKKLVYKGGRVAGSLFLGDTSEAGTVEGWIRKGMKREACDPKVLEHMFLPRVQSFSALGALCPICKFQIQVEDRFEEGAIVSCPACGADFRLERMPNGVFRAVLVGA